MNNALHIVSILSIISGFLCACIVLLSIFPHRRQPMKIMESVWPLTGLWGGWIGLWAYFRMGIVQKKKPEIKIPPSENERSLSSDGTDTPPPPDGDGHAPPLPLAIRCSLHPPLRSGMHPRRHYRRMVYLLDSPVHRRKFHCRTMDTGLCAGTYHRHILSICSHPTDGTHLPQVDHRKGF